MINKVCIIVCWFGELPEYINIWNMSCSENKNFDFLFFTDATISTVFPNNVKIIPFTIAQFEERVQRLLCERVSLKRPYRICDFRPCYGLVFEKEIAHYDFWGYCDVDVVFGKIDEFISDSLLCENDAIFNGGHFSLFRNTEQINNLFRLKGACFDFSEVATHDAVFAFDEITGIQSIAKNNNVRAKYMVPYIETEIRYRQLRSRLEKNNPKHQLFYWEDGNLYRAKKENNELYYQKYAYIHLQKRKMTLNNEVELDSYSFWITPSGFEKKLKKGAPTETDFNFINPYEGEKNLKIQNFRYKIKKIAEIVKRNPYQIYVRIKQEKMGINSNQGTIEDSVWAKY